MNIYEKKKTLFFQIHETEKLLDSLDRDSLTYISLTYKLKDLKEELENLTTDSEDVDVQLLFSGDAVIGSAGIETQFLSNFLKPFQNLVDLEVLRYCDPSKIDKCHLSKVKRSKLYISEVARGSFGVRLTKPEQYDLLDLNQTNESVEHIINTIQDLINDEQYIDQLIEQSCFRIIDNFHKMLKILYKASSHLEISSSNIGHYFSKDDITIALSRINSVEFDEFPQVINGRLRGILLDSQTFEVIDNEGKQIKGGISDDLTEGELKNYAIEFTDKECEIHYIEVITKKANGKEKIEYILQKIRNI